MKKRVFKILIRKVYLPGIRLEGKGGSNISQKKLFKKKGRRYSSFRRFVKLHKS